MVFTRHSVYEALSLCLPLDETYILTFQTVLSQTRRCEVLDAHLLLLHYPHLPF